MNVREIAPKTERQLKKKNCKINTLHHHKISKKHTHTPGLCTRHFTVGGGYCSFLSPYLTNFSREEVIYLNPKPRQIIITRPRRAQKHKVPQPKLPLKLLLLQSQNLRGRSRCRYFFNFNFIF